MRQNAYYRNLKWTFEDLLQCYCYAIKTKITIIRYHVSHPASAGKESEMSELRTRVANLAFLKPDFEILALFDHLWLFLEVKKSQTKSGFFWLFFQSDRLGSGKTLSELHIHYKSPLKTVYDHAGCTRYWRDFMVALKMIDFIVNNTWKLHLFL